MSTYAFKAMDLAGAPLRGQVEAESKQVVSDELKSRGLIVLDIAEKHRSRELNLTLFERIKLTDLAIFCTMSPILNGSFKRIASHCGRPVSERFQWWNAAATPMTPRMITYQ